MKSLNFNTTQWKLLALASMLFASLAVHAEIPATAGNVFDLYAKSAQIQTPDGDSLRIWGFTFTPGADATAQYPGPTLELQEGALIVISLTNTDIPYPVSLEFPGQTGVVCKVDTNGNGTADAIEPDCPPTGLDNTAVDPFIYEFTATNPGTFLYQSGISPQVQVDMGLVGAMIVRPNVTVTLPDNDPAIGLAYDDPSTAYDREYLFFLSEMDPRLHYLAEDQALVQWDNASYHSVLFFMNGRNAPDSMADHFVQQLPHQPYGSLVKMYPGERVLGRVLNVGRTQHPLHLHGNHFAQISRDGNMLPTPIMDYTLNAIPGSTADFIFEWTGKRMGWDIYDSATADVVGGHTCNDAVDNRTLLAPGDGYDDTSWEWCEDHGKEIPVVIPEDQDLSFGGFYGGSPYLGNLDSLPIGEGGLNPSGGMVFMWHSHSERELTNNDIFPGGMMTMLIVERRP